METNSSGSVDHSHGSYNHTNGHFHSHHGFDLNLTSLLLIVIPIFLLVLLIAILVLAALLRRSKSKKSSSITGTNKLFAHTTINITDSPETGNNGCISIGANSQRLLSQRRSRGVQVFTYKELELATDNFNEQNVIGNGGFGVVYKGVLNDRTLAAIKMLHKERKQGERAFRIQVDLLSRLNSPHLVELLGYCADQNHRLLVFEFMENGSLQNHLQRSSPNGYPQTLDWGARLRIALDCAKALEYLHEHASPPIIHRDFKCSNILLDQNLRAKVSGFGLAKICSEKINGQISTRVLGTTGYLAPEWVHCSYLFHDLDNGYCYCRIDKNETHGIAEWFWSPAFHE